MNKSWGFKKGDIIKAAKDSIWGNATFEVVNFHGNDYCPMLYLNIVGKFYNNGKPKCCNISVGEARLINAINRPFRKLAKSNLLKLVVKGNEEAKREFKIRVNTKTL